MISENNNQITLFVCKKYTPLITIAVIAFSLSIWIGGEYHQDMTQWIIPSTAVIMGCSIAIYSYKLFNRYKSSETISSSFLILSIAYFGYAIAEALWAFLTYIGDESYPSVADISYVIYFTFAILFVGMTLVHYSSKITRSNILIISGVMITCLVFYTALSLQGVESYSFEEIGEFYYGGVFVTLASLLMGMSILTAYKLKNNLKILWIIIAVVMTINSMTDVWYYTIENIVGYEYGSVPIDTAYFAGDIILLFALHLHRKLI